MTIIARVGHIRTRAWGHPELPLVPARTSFVEIKTAVELSRRGGFAIRATVRCPTLVIEFCIFVSIPAFRSAGVRPVFPDSLPLIPLVEGLQAAGYLGSGETLLRTGTVDFTPNFRPHGLRFAVSIGLWNGGFVPRAVLAKTNPHLVLVGALFGTTN